MLPGASPPLQKPVRLRARSWRVYAAMSDKSRIRLLLALLALALAGAGAQSVASDSRTEPGLAPEASEAPVARDVDLSQPVYLDPPAPESVPEGVPEGDGGASGAPAPEAPSSPEPAAAREPLLMLGEQVQPGTSARLSWNLDQQFEGIAVPTPVLVVHGQSEGPTVCLTAAIHGDEINGIEIVRRVLYELEGEKLGGTVVGVPIVNLQGFRRGSRYLADRRDLNRYFPGSEHGSSASRIAFAFFRDVISHCDALVDIHTGSLARTNLPQLRADMKVPEVAELTQGFGATSVLHHPGTEGTLRRAAVEAGIPAVTFETGEPGRLQETKIAHGAKGIHTLLAKLDMTHPVSIWGEPEPVYYQSTWVRADRGGLLFRDVDLGQSVREGEVLGTITDPITNLRSELKSPVDGRVLGMALNQVVMPGFAAFRIGIRTGSDELADPDEPGAEDVVSPGGDLAGAGTEEDENS